MKTEPDTVLSDALRSIDAARRRAFVTVAAGWLASVGAILWFAYVLQTSDNLKRALAAAVVALALVVAVSAFAALRYVAQVTRRILRALEAASAPGGPLEPWDGRAGRRADGVRGATLVAPRARP